MSLIDFKLSNRISYGNIADSNMHTIYDLNSALTSSCSFSMCFQRPVVLPFFVLITLHDEEVEEGARLIQTKTNQPRYLWHMLHMAEDLSSEILWKYPQTRLCSFLRTFSTPCLTSVSSWAISMCRHKPVVFLPFVLTSFPHSLHSEEFGENSLK